MPPKTTTKAAADKAIEKAPEPTAEKPATEGPSPGATEAASVVTPPPDGGLEAAAAALAAEALPTTMPTPSVVGIDPAAPGGDSTMLVDVELPQDDVSKIRVIALHPVKHDGVVYGPGLPNGDELHVTPGERDDLVKIGAVEAGDAV